MTKLISSTMIPKGLLLLLIYCFSMVGWASEQLSPSYRLNAGDSIAISVWNEEQLQQEITILPDGRFSFPLVGELEAKGKTAQQLQQLITQKLTNFLTDPLVTVTVVGVDGNTVYVLGKVAQPGRYVMQQQADVVKALSLAGGLSSYAQENDIIVLRRQGGRQTTYPVHYADIKSGQSLATNIVLHGGDVLIIP